MSRETIYREDAIKALHEEWDGGWLEVTGEWIADNCEAVLNRLPSADRPQGEWKNMGDFERCSVCNSTHLKEFQSYYGKTIWIKTPYCPYCGARMKGADDE